MQFRALPCSSVQCRVVTFLLELCSEHAGSVHVVGVVNLGTGREGQGRAGLAHSLVLRAKRTLCRLTLAQNLNLMSPQ